MSKSSEYLFNDASDVILRCGNKYMNAMTKKCGSSVKEVIRDRNFIVVSKNSETTGYCVKMIDEELVVFHVVLKEENNTYRWDILDHYYLTGNNERTSLKFFPAHTELDIYGQSVNSYRTNIASGSRKVLLDYFGRPMIIQHNDFIGDSTVEDYCSINSFAYNYMPGDYKEHLKIVECNADGIINRTDEEINIPDVAYAEMKKYTDYILQKAEKKDFILRPFEKLVCFLQNISGEAVLRSFQVIVTQNYPLKTSEIGLYEVCRIKIDGVMEPSVISLSSMVPVWCDSLKGTKLEYSEAMIKAAVDGFTKKYEKIDVEEAIVKEYGIYPNDLMVAASMKTDFILEKLLNLKGYGSICIKDILIRAVKSGEDAVLQTFGDINENGRTLNQILELPNGMLEYGMAHMSSEDCFRYIKSVFKYGNEQYFMRLNREDAVFLWDSLFINAYRYRYLVDIFSILYHMIQAFGVCSWKDYVKFLLDTDTPVTALSYYMEVMYKIKKSGRFAALVKDFDWKVDYDAMRRVMPTLNAIKRTIDDDESDKQDEKLTAMCSTWEKYLFSGHGYHINYPKKPEDIIEEGVKLNHCVSGFLPAILKKKTEIIFIRKDREPDKPYFTLEINGGAVKQCHGVNNKSIKEEDGSLRQFLEEFCKHTGIEFSEGEKLYDID